MNIEDQPMPETAEKEFSPEIIQEIRQATQTIENLIGNTDITPDHLERVLVEARAVAAKYEFTNGNEDFDVALDILVDTIKNTELLEDRVVRDIRLEGED